LRHTRFAADADAIDYVRPGIYSPDARCYLKNRASRPVASPCCVASFERQAAAAIDAGRPGPSMANPGPAGPPAAPPISSTPMFNTNLLGSDYRNIDLPTDDWAQCQSTCKADSHCLAWTLVRPGVQGPSARCWLKSKIPQPKSSGCCTSGVERAEAK
jgi:hypothetical protein